MGFYLGGLIIGRIFVSEICGAFLFLFFVFVFLFLFLFCFVFLGEAGFYYQNFTVLGQYLGNTQPVVQLVEVQLNTCEPVINSLRLSRYG